MLEFRLENAEMLFIWSWLRNCVIARSTLVAVVTMRR